MLFDKKKIAKQKKKLRKLYAKEMSGLAEPGTTKTCLDSWIVNARRGNTHKICVSMYAFYNDLVRSYQNDGCDENCKS